MSHHEPEEEIVECRECGAPFNLAAQFYYDNLCPSCKRETDEEATWKGCAICQEKIPPEELTYYRTEASFDGPSETLPKHEDCEPSRGYIL